LAETDIDSILFEYLGRICAGWSTVEAHQGALLAFLLRADPLRMQVITHAMSGSTINDWTKTLCDVDIEDETILDDVLQLLKELDETRGDRNTLVHGLWRRGPEPNTLLINSLRLDRHEIMKDELFTLGDLQETLGRIISIDRRLTYIGKHLGYYQS
jgi:hypothetical protein